MSELVELLFFDTFAHENSEELNLDLVQFPKPVYVTEVRIIPLGARVQADFPGGVRLGATNPSQFQIEFFVNDLGKPGASTFESLGGFEYNQNGCINLVCVPDDSIRKIPTDGLVLRGWYTTITLAVYGTLTANITEQIIPAVTPSLQSQTNIQDVQQINTLENEWSEPIQTVGIEYNQQQSTTQYPPQYPQANETYPASTQPPAGEYNEYYNNELPKDPRSYHHTPETDWDTSKPQTTRGRSRERRYSRSQSRERSRENYARRFSDNERKRPRTPPIHSPKRPHTPHVQSDDEVSKDEKSNVEDSTTQMDVEEFEPILSDEDILDDGESYQEVDYDYTGYTNNDDLIKLFIPGSTLIQKYETKSKYAVLNGKLTIMCENLRNCIAIIDDYFKSSITRYTPENFERLNGEIKEEFIHLSEKLIQIFDGNLNIITELYAKINDDSIKHSDDETKQIDYIINTLVQWIFIALDFNLANAQEQPVYKIRHIKCGVKLAEWVSSSDLLLKQLWKRKFYMHEVLLQLYEREFMALSIKLMILKALDAYLMQKIAIDLFLSMENGMYYRSIVNMLRRNPSVRLKFALNSILKKLNVYEAFNKLRYKVTKLISNDDGDIKNGDNVKNGIVIEEIADILFYIQDLINYRFSLTQPKRFLPVSAQFEINRNDSRNILVELLKTHDMLPLFAVLLTNQNTLSLTTIKTPIYEILQELTQSQDGLRYLQDNLDTINLLIKSVDQNSDFYDLQMLKSHKLFVSMAYKLQCLYHCDALMNLSRKYKDYDHVDIVDQLHAIYCLTFSHIGKLACAEVLGLDDNIKCLLNFLDVASWKSDSAQNKLKKSASIAYIIDLLHLTVTLVANLSLLESYHRALHEIINQHDLFEAQTLNKLKDLDNYLKPYETYVSNYNVANLVDLINKNLSTAHVSTSNGALITALRILQKIGISPYSNNENQKISNLVHENFVELKYKHVILQLYTLDGVALLTKLLEMVCAYYEQPSLHTSTFVSNQGVLIVNLLSPCVLLLQKMLTYVIQCRNTHFKDLSSVQFLLQTYNLCFNYPSTSLAYDHARSLCRVIVDTLLVYTQPISEEDALNKSLWSLMIGELIKYILQAPYTFIPGLLIFSEMLPLPLPIQTVKHLSNDEVAWMITLRKLWSAHLHPHTSALQDLIGKLCTTTHQALLGLLRKVCAQIADLAANSACVIARGMLDNVHSAIVLSNDVNVTKLVCNGYIARLMNFLACLVTHNSLKAAILNLFHNLSGTKTDEKYAAIIQAFSQILRSTSNFTSHVQTQECVLSIIQSFCDTEITLYQTTNNPDILLANALPIKEHLLVYLNTILDHLNGDNSFVTYLPALRTLLLLSEHDYGFYYMRDCLLKYNSGTPAFDFLLLKVEQCFAKENTDCLATLNTLIEFLRVCAEAVVDEVVDGATNNGNNGTNGSGNGNGNGGGGGDFPARKMKFTLGELRTLIAWKSDGALVKIDEKLKTLVQEDSNFETLHESLQALLNILKATDNSNEEAISYTETILPMPETLLAQFSARPLITSSDISDERLTTSFWLTSLNDENDADLENVTCDLTEICRQDLSADVNIIKQVEKLCRVCPSQNTQQVEKEKRINPQKDKMKRPFVTSVRGRGFQRTVQVRSDLFRSRPPNTSRPPSLHVDDFVALETCGAQPTGPTGYNKISRELLATSRITRGTRGRSFMTSERTVQYRQMSWWGPSIGRAPY